MKNLYPGISSESTYLVCPDPDCNLFTKPNCNCPCEKECPQQDKLIKIVRCSCGEFILLPGDHNSLKRVDHECENGSTGCTFVRGNGKYQRGFSIPERI